MGGGRRWGRKGSPLLTGEPDGSAGAGGRGRGVVLGGAGEGAAQLVPAVSPSSRTHTAGNNTASCLFFLKSRIIGNFDSYLAMTAQPVLPALCRRGNTLRRFTNIWPYNLELVLQLYLLPDGEKGQRPGPEGTRN